jgi:hypothetical protein
MIRCHLRVTRRLPTMRELSRGGSNIPQLQAVHDTVSSQLYRAGDAGQRVEFYRHPAIALYTLRLHGSPGISG